MNYKRASTTELIEALGEQERHPDLKLVQALLKRGAEVIPDLSDMVETKTGWAQIHAALLLCELRAESALPALQQAISALEGHDLADWLVDDALEKFGPPALDVLETVAADKTVEWYQRAVACRVMMIIAYRHPETYERVTAFLRGLLPDPNLDWQAYGSYEAIREAVDEPRIWTSVVGRLCDLRDPKSYDLIGQLFQAGLVDEMVMDAAFYRQAYQESSSPVSVSEKPVDLLTRYRRNRPQSRRLSLRDRRGRRRNR
jgi:hypothetical protein